MTAEKLAAKYLELARLRRQLLASPGPHRERIEREIEAGRGRAK